MAITSEKTNHKKTSLEEILTTQEGKAAIAHLLENQVAKLPVNFYLWAGLGSVLGSAALQVFGKGQRSIFIGHWAPTFLLLGLYAKLSRQVSY